MTKLLSRAHRHLALIAELAALAAVLVGISAIYAPAAWIVGGSAIILAIELQPDASRESGGKK